MKKGKKKYYNKLLPSNKDSKVTYSDKFKDHNSKNGSN